MNNETVNGVTPREAKESLFEVLAHLEKDEIEAMLEAVKQHKINSNLYWGYTSWGECGCLLGNALHHRDWFSDEDRDQIPLVRANFIDLYHIQTIDADDEEELRRDIWAYDYTLIENYIGSVVPGFDPHNVLPNVQAWIEEWIASHGD